MAFKFARFVRQGPGRVDEGNVSFLDLPVVEWGMVAVYVLFATAWFIFSRLYLDWLGEDPRDSPALQAMNALNFILTSGLLLYVVLRRSYQYRRRAQEVSRLSQERLEAVALATTDAIWDWDLVTNSVWRSEGFQRLFGYSPDEISGDIDWWIRRLHPEDRKEIVDGIQGVANGTGRMWSGQYRFRRKDGSYADVLDRTCILRDPAGRPIRVVGGLSDITERRRAEQHLERSRERLRALTVRLQTAREEERTRVAREIHDELGQILTALKLNLERLESDLGTRSAEDASLNSLLERLVETAEMAETALESVRRIATELRPVALDSLGLAAAMRQEVDRFAQRTGIHCEVSLPEAPLELRPETVTVIYRILQEALTNVLRHAQASEIRIHLGREGEVVRLTVRDNGRGIDPECSSRQSCLGLLGMRERASALGGEVSVRRAEPHGTEVALSLPLGTTSVKELINSSDDPNPDRG